MSGTSELTQLVGVFECLAPPLQRGTPAAPSACWAWCMHGSDSRGDSRTPHRETRGPRVCPEPWALGRRWRDWALVSATCPSSFRDWLKIQFSLVTQSCLTLCSRWPKYWSFSFNISLSNEYSGLISSRMDWLDLLAVQGTLKNLQHQSSKASVLWCSAFFVSTSYIDTWLLEKP